MDPDSKRLRVAVTDARGRPVRTYGLRRWLESVAPARAHGVLGVALVSDARIRNLNLRYRRKNQKTDVLAFPADSQHGADSNRRIRSPLLRDLERRVPNYERRASSPEPRYLGDIVIATGVARRQSREARHSYGAELRVLALHGLLHLLGYDHHTREDEARMKQLEARLRRKGGLNTGLMERSAEERHAHSPTRRRPSR